MKKILTVILDGFGIREEEYGNAVKMANMPNFKKIWEEYPHTTLHASEEYVGLPKGQFGTSEVGHMTIGAGKLLKSKLNVIYDAIASKEISSNKAFKELIDFVKENNSALHIMGLVSDGGVHSDLPYIKSLIQIVKDEGINDLYFHVITDGRDTEKNSSCKYIRDLKTVLDDTGVGKIATISGRFYAMDRDKKWRRTEKYYNMVVNGEGLVFNDIDKAINACYKKELDDENLPPFIIDRKGKIKDNDGLFWVNFRIDRAIQILTALTVPAFNEFTVKKFENLKTITLFDIDESITSPYMFEDEAISKNSLGKYISALGLSQARIAETEKYAYVTFSFDGGLEEKLPHAHYYIFDSPNVSNYASTPEMKSIDIAKQTIKCMENDIDFILVNIASPDMLGHTGNLNKTIEALEIVDKCLGDIAEAVSNNFYTMFLLADHGNSDYMIGETGEVVKTHSLSEVPFIITDKKIKLNNGGSLWNVAPTILDYMDIAVPREMKDSESLIKE